MQMFKFEGVQLRTMDLEGKPHFVGVDVARALMYANPSKAVIDHCKGVSKLGIPSDGGTQETNVIPEGDVYRLIVKAADQSRNEVIKENAERFERVVFDEILPSIRKHGAYMTPQALESALQNPDAMIQILTRLKEEQTERTAAENKLESQRPLVVFAESLQVSEDSMSVGELAKLLKQNGIDIGERRLFVILREEGYLIKRFGSQYNLPTQRSMEMGIMEIKIGSRASASDGSKVTHTPKITGKGQMYFINKFKKNISA